ncbi:MAG TPA: Kdo hydroxylase family protein [Ramlibacter sp.]|nr:Kdo hydroxylase family protein [Ramlibacter sp.]
MRDRIVELGVRDWHAPGSDPQWIAAVEDGKVLYFPQLAFCLSNDEGALLRPELLAPGVRNISWDKQRGLKGVAGDGKVQAAVTGLVSRFALQATALVHGLFPAYTSNLRAAPASLRPMSVSNRKQSVRADDRRLHVDAFPSRPNYGERILRVFANINPQGRPRVWRVGEPFEDVARRFVPQARPYSLWQAKVLKGLHVTKSLRSEYDHLMLQIHDRMKADDGYQRDCPQVTMNFPTGSAWVCFSDQTVHAAMSGQYMMEQTFHLPAAKQYNPDMSPLAILGRLAGHPVS